MTRYKVNLDTRAEPSPMLQRNGRDPGSYESPLGETLGENYEEPLEVEPRPGRARRVRLRKSDVFTTNARGNLDLDLTVLGTLEAGAQEFKTITASEYTITVFDAAPRTIVLADSSGGTIIVRLPVVASAVGYRFTVIRTGSSTVTIAPNGSELIGGSASKGMNVLGDSISFVAAPTAWWVT